MITKITLYKEYINENIKIPIIDNSKYLLIDDKTSSIQFIIQDKSIIYGYGELLKRNDYYQIINIATEKGFGPLLYDSIMLYLDKPIRPNRSLSLNAYNVWKKYLNNRNDVYKEKISITDNDYWNSIDLNFKPSINKESLQIINTLYTIKDINRKEKILKWFNNSYINFAKSFEDQYPKWKENRFNIAKKWFNKKYIV